MYEMWLDICQTCSMNKQNLIIFAIGNHHSGNSSLAHGYTGLSAHYIAGTFPKNPFWWSCRGKPTTLSECPQCCQNEARSATSLIFGAERSHREYSPVRDNAMSFLAKNCWICTPLWAEALSWWKRTFFSLARGRGFSSHFRVATTKHHSRSWDSQSGQQGHILGAQFAWCHRKRSLSSWLF